MTTPASQKKTPKPVKGVGAWGIAGLISLAAIVAQEVRFTLTFCVIVYCVVEVLP
jgi:hypothetical protein